MSTNHYVLTLSVFGLLTSACSLRQNYRFNTNVMEPDTAKYAVADFAQVRSQMLSGLNLQPFVVGAPASDGTLRTNATGFQQTYNNVVLVLPQNNGDTPPASGLMVRLQLAESGCNQAYVQEMLPMGTQVVFPGVAINMQATGDIVEQVAKGLAQTFWSRQPTAEEMAILKDAVDKLRAEPQTSAAQGWIGLCTIIAGAEQAIKI